MTRCGIVTDEVIFFRDDPTVERFVKHDLAALQPEIIYISSDEVWLTERGFDLLSEYSTSVPSGKADGKVWACNTRSERGWIMREYVDMGDPTRWTIKDRRITIGSRFP